MVVPLCPDYTAQMPAPSPPDHTPSRLTSFYRSGDAMRSRSVSGIVRTHTLEVPAPPARLTADWERETLQHLGLEAGDVEPLSLPRARMRWPDFKRCVQAMQAWTHTLGLADVLTTSDIALMTCRGARYHHDGGQYGAAAFCNLFLSEDKGLDVHFPHSGQRIPLVRGTAVVFDTGQPHAVIRRGSNGFNAADFTPAHDCTVVFLTWELPIEDPHVQRALQVEFDVAAASAQPLTEEQLWWNGARADVHPNTGQWCQPAKE
jgi:hypothetical protein